MKIASSYLALVGTLMSIPHGATQSETLRYTNGNIAVDVLFEYTNPPELDNKKCATFVSGADEYQQACFISDFNERGIMTGCDITFDGESCEFCSVCNVVPDDTIGITYDCRNVEPGEANAFTCAAITNMTIQEILVDEFIPTAFTFDLEVEGAETPTGSGGDEPSETPTSEGVTASATQAGVLALAAAAFLF